jgi:hypothetical protein
MRADHRIRERDRRRQRDGQCRQGKTGSNASLNTSIEV